MKNHRLISLALILMLAAACQKEEVSPASNETVITDAGSDLKNKKGDNGGKGGKKDRNNSDDTAEPTDSITYASSYILSTSKDADPLHRFLISKSGDLILFRTDSTVTSWGEDYWGYWKDPADFKDNQVVHHYALSKTIYELNKNSDGTYDVKRTLIASRSYFPGSPIDTTVTYPGTYRRE